MNHPDIINKFNIANKRLLLLDYDGTLVNIASTPDKAKPTKEVLNTLGTLYKKPNTNVFIITGRNNAEIKALFGNLNIQIIAEHGSNIALSQNCKFELIKIMNEVSEACEGSFIEEKTCALAWHYRNSNMGDSVSRILIQQIKPVAERHQLKIIDGNKVVEVINKQGGKGNAVRQLLSNQNYDFILAIGDDTTDEAMFEELNSNVNAVTVKVGRGATRAHEVLSSPEKVIELLQQL